MQFNFKKILPHLLVIVLFVIASLAYFYPVLQGKAIFQSDIVQYTGMAKQQNDFRKQTGEETYWTNSAFGGMPTYQLGAKYPHNYSKKLDLTLRFLPRPADYLFLYFISMYILFLVLKVDYKLALVGALAFGFSTYLIIILGVGHNAKAHAIAYMPLVISGIILTFRGKYIRGFLLTTVAMALELVANHFQMTYYLLLLVICIGIAYMVDAFRKKMLPQYFKAIGVMALGVLLAMGLNATNIMATKEYADTSTRGKSELTINPDGSPKASTDGLDYDYITEYSYGKLESFDLLIPKFMGGGSEDDFPKDSEAVQELLKVGATPQEARQFLSEQIPFYWGDQPIVAAPAYIGATIIFLAVLALFLVQGRIKWWIVAGLTLSLLLSWGKNFSLLTEFFIDYVPLYNKFRAVSSIQVILEILVPLLAIVGLHKFFLSPTESSDEGVNDLHSREVKKKALFYSTGIVGGLTIIFILFGSQLFSFASLYDSLIIEQMGIPFMDAVREDRMSVFRMDTLRSILFVVLTATVLWLVFSEKLKKSYAIGIIAFLIVVDLVGIDKRYVNADNFVISRIMEQPFLETSADIKILQDDGYFRVYDATRNAFSSGQASYYHNALGGYHAAKPGRIQDIDDFYLTDGDAGILNMMNVKYILVYDMDGKPAVQQNPFANGPAWFVGNVLTAKNANEEILLLDSLNTKTTAVIHTDFLNKIPTENIRRDSTASIDLVSHQPNHLVYETASKTDQLAVFSEVYYPKGWDAYIDGKPVEHFRANYTLRAMIIPDGVHQIEFKFEPRVIKTGSKITLVSSILFFLLLMGGLFLQLWKKKPSTLT
ncbi:MAG: YfhO family protein [Bacteroidetes bacterium]|nr:YfhO family protein [Bacteroidota bacterium]